MRSCSAPHLGDVGVARDAAGEPRGERLEHREHVEHVAHVLRVNRAHDRAARRHQLDQPFAREELERLAQRRARHAELRAELAFVDARARQQRALDDQVAHASRRPGRAGCGAGDRRRGRRQRGQDRVTA